MNEKKKHVGIKNIFHIILLSINKKKKNNYINLRVLIVVSLENDLTH